MKITVINGTEKHGVTYRLKEVFLDQLRNDSDITERMMSISVKMPNTFKRLKRQCLRRIFLSLRHRHMCSMQQGQ